MVTCVVLKAGSLLLFTSTGVLVCHYLRHYSRQVSYFFFASFVGGRRFFFVENVFERSFLNFKTVPPQFE